MALSLQIWALPPQPEKEKPKKDIETSDLKRSASKSKSQMEKSKRANPKLNKGLFGNMPLFLNPLFSQLHFLRPQLNELPDSLGV
jgi:hypothetical protein